MMRDVNVVRIDPDALRRARIGAGLTQRQLADLCEWNPGPRRIDEYESGESFPTVEAVARIRAALGLHLKPAV